MTDRHAWSSRFRSTVAVIWLTLISLFALADHVALSRFRAKSADLQGERAELTGIQTRVMTVEKSVRALERQPVPVSEAKLRATRDILEARLASLEQTIATTASKDALASVQDRLRDFDARLRLRPARWVSAPASSRVDPISTIASRTQEQPFTILGVEWRGGERFLSITPLGATAPDQVVLLRAGDPLSGLPGEWQLKSLEGNVAVFVSQGHPLRIQIS